MAKTLPETGMVMSKNDLLLKYTRKNISKLKINIIYRISSQFVALLSCDDDNERPYIAFIALSAMQKHIRSRLQIGCTYKNKSFFCINMLRIAAQKSNTKSYNNERLQRHLQRCAWIQLAQQ